MLTFGVIVGIFYDEISLMGPIGMMGLIGLGL
jgi:hypothetical protein